MDPKRVLAAMTAEEMEELDKLLADDPKLWHPLAGPQTAADESQADIIGFGGAGGGGKSDWICGQSLTRHRRSIIFRENGTELVGINTRLREMLTGKSSSAYNGRDQRWTFQREAVACEIELGSFPDIGDEQKYRGRPHDGLFFDEATNMRESQVRFLFAWARTVEPDQKVTIGLTFNPPNTVEGRWIIRFFAPWLDPKHPNPALPGELRWFAVVAGVDIEVPDNRPFVLLGSDREPAEKRERCYTFNPDDYRAEDVIKPQSRTFIPSRVTDNPFLANTGYMRTLQALPEPLRSQMLKGDFVAGMKDDAFQVIPTAWIEAAMARWKRPTKLEPMDSLGVDVAKGGEDDHVIIPRHKLWFGEPVAHKGADVPNAAIGGSYVVAELRDGAVIHIDLFGVGAEVYGFLMGLQLQTIGVNFGDLVPNARDRTGRLRFFNLRSYLWWSMRELLNPINNTGVQLPPHKRLLADLAAPKFSVPSQTIKVQSRDEIIKTLGRSPDYGTAAILASLDTPKTQVLQALMLPPGSMPRHGSSVQEYDPYANL